MSHTNNTFDEIREALIKGYLEMSEINLNEAELGLKSDNESLRISEERLTECE